MPDHRADVLRCVEAYPGIHVRGIERRLGLSSRLAAYHLAALEAAGRVACVQEKGYARYLSAASRRRMAPHDVAFVCAMRRPVALRVTVLLLAEGPRSHGELASRLGLAKASVSYHLAALVGDGILRREAHGRLAVYSVADEDHVRRLLARFTPLPEDLDPFEAVWRDLFG